MTDREKLIEILRVPIYPHLDADPAEVVADYLLDNGVTFAKDINVPGWIPGKKSYMYRCSVCNGEFYFCGMNPNYNYCPRCGRPFAKEVE